MRVPALPFALAGIGATLAAVFLLDRPDPKPTDPAAPDPTAAQAATPAAAVAPNDRPVDTLVSDDAPPPRDGERRVLIDRGNFRAYTVYSNCVDGRCDSNVVYDNPYGELSMTDLRLLAEQDSTAAFQFAVRSFVAATTEAEVDQARGYALKSVALAPAEDAGWLYNGAIEHLGLGVTSDPAASDEDIANAYVWHEAGALLGLVEQRFRERARQAAAERGLLTPELRARARTFAAELRELRLKVSGVPFDGIESGSNAEKDRG